MKIEIKKCNNVDNGSIEIKENTLNIKYAINGTGKSTIAKAILASINDRNKGSKELLELIPESMQNRGRQEQIRYFPAVSRLNGRLNGKHLFSVISKVWL